MRGVGIQVRDVKVSRSEAPSMVKTMEQGRREAKDRAGTLPSPEASWAKDVGRRVYAEGRRLHQSKLAPARAEEAFSGPSSLGAIGLTIG